MQKAELFIGWKLTPETIFLGTHRGPPAWWRSSFQGQLHWASCVLGVESLQIFMGESIQMFMGVVIIYKNYQLPDPDIQIC